MTAIIAIFAAFIAAACAMGFVRPAAFRAILDRQSEQTSWVLAVVIRLAFGTLLLITADDLRFSYAMTVIGWIAIVAAVVFLLLGPERLGRMISWWLGSSDSVFRVSMVFAVAFALFLVYVAV